LDEKTEQDFSISCCSHSGAGKPQLMDTCNSSNYAVK